VISKSSTRSRENVAADFIRPANNFPAESEASSATIRPETGLSCMNLRMWGNNKPANWRKFQTFPTRMLAKSADTR
jgi:hypothetical protein